MKTNIIPDHKSMASLDTDINQFQSKYNSSLQKINILETTTESMDYPVISVIILMNADGLGKWDACWFLYSVNYILISEVHTLVTV